MLTTGEPAAHRLVRSRISSWLAYSGGFYISLPLASVPSAAGGVGFENGGKPMISPFRISLLAVAMIAALGMVPASAQRGGWNGGGGRGGFNRGFAGPRGFVGPRAGFNRGFVGPGFHPGFVGPRVGFNRGFVGPRFRPGFVGPRVGFVGPRFGFVGPRIVVAPPPPWWGPPVPWWWRPPPPWWGWGWGPPPW